MNAFAFFDTALCARVVLTLAHFLWQGAAVFLLATIAAAALRRASANARYTVLVAAMLFMAACPPVMFVVLGEGPRVSIAPDPHTRHEATVASGVQSLQRLQAPEERAARDGSPAASGEDALHMPAAATTPHERRDADGPHTTPGIDWARYAPHAVLCYLLGAAIMFARLVLAVYGGQRLRRRSQPVEDGTILMAFSRQARALGLSFTPAIAFCRDVAVPTVVGVLRPMILLPLSLMSGLTPGQVEVLLSHELAHIRRHDYLVNFLQRVIEAVLFFHPAVWLLSRRIRTERENCCDDMVLAVGGQRFAYAESLVRMAELSGGHRAPYVAADALGADGRRSHLRNRIARLIAGPAGYEPVRLRRTWLFVLPVLATAALTLNCLVPARQADSASAPTSATPVSDDRGAEGTRGPANAIPVRTWIDGAVAEVNANTGETVKKGDLLVQLDDRAIRLEVDAAKVRLQALRQEQDLLRRQFEEGRRPRDEVQKAATGVTLAEIELEKQQLRLARTRVYSPTDGTVLAADGPLTALVGRHVTAGDVLLYVMPAGQEAKARSAVGEERIAAVRANAIPVRAPAAGIVAEVKVEAGQTVKRGELLVQLDDRAIRLDVEAAKVRLQAVREQAERIAAMQKLGAVPDLDVRKAAAEVQAAEIELERQQLRLHQTRIASPADGTVDTVDGTPAGLTGANVAGGQILLYVAPPGTVPAGIVGTWFFDNPRGDDEQMAVFPDGRVVILYSNGHKDETRIVDGAVQLAEYHNVRVRMSLVGDETLVQTSDSWNGSARRWTRTDPVPRTELLRPLSGPPATQPGHAAARPARGRIAGRVVNAETRRPIAGAALVIDHRGDATGSGATEQARSEGRYVTATSAADGSYVLENVALSGQHTVVAASTGFIRYAEDIALTPDQPTVTLDIPLRPGGTIVGSTEGDEDKTEPTGAVVRVTAADGRMLDLQRSWAPLPYRRVRTDRPGGFTISELDTGVYSLDVFEEGREGAAYIGALADVRVTAGQTTHVRVPRATDGGSIVVSSAKPPIGLSPTEGEKQTLLVILSRQTGPLTWCDGWYHPEDDRLLSLRQIAYLVAGADANRLTRFENLPPGRYAVYVIDLAPLSKAGGTPAAVVAGSPVQVKAGQAVRVDLAFVPPEQRTIGNPAAVRALFRQIAAPAGPTTLQRFCDELTKQTDGKLRLVTAPLLADTQLTPPATRVAVLRLLETVCEPQGWRFTLDGDTVRISKKAPG